MISSQQAACWQKVTGQLWVEMCVGASSQASAACHDRGQPHDLGPTTMSPCDLAESTPVEEGSGVGGGPELTAVKQKHNEVILNWYYQKFHQ